MKRKTETQRFGSRLSSRYIGIVLFGVAIASSVTGCAKGERFVLAADQAQVGAGARIELEGKVGQIKMPATPGWPKGLDRAVTLNPDSTNPLNQFWTVTMEPKTELVFIRSPKGWVCKDCVYLQMPIMWHPVAT